jgi:hypothetical protein
LTAARRRARATGAALAASCVSLAAAGPTALASAPPGELAAAAAPPHELSPAQRIALPGGAVVERYQQRVGGLPVLASEAVLTKQPDGPARLVADTTRPAIASPGAARTSRRRAVDVAEAQVGVEALRAPLSARLAIQPGDGGRLIWRVLLPAARPLGDFEVLVDAVSGDVVASSDLMRRYRMGTAKLYKVNPVVQHDGARHLRSDRRDHDTPLLRRLRRHVTLPNLNDGQDCLRGRWVHALRGEREKETCKRNLHWKGITRSDSRFEALEVYFQINRSQEYIQSLGFSDSNPSPNGIADRPQRAVADAYGLDNSQYSPFSQNVTYGRGGVDDAEDGDVIVHEYAHAMQDSQSRAFGRSTRYQAIALAEGSSDYWAAAMSALVPRTANEDDVCMFDWDATTYGRFYPRVPPESSGRRCGRRADVRRTVRQAGAVCRPVLFGRSFAPDPHCVGAVWSSGLWDIRSGLAAQAPDGGARMDQIYLAAQFLYTGRESFKDAAHALLCADESLHPQGAPGDCRGQDFALIHHEMRQRGILS